MGKSSKERVVKGFYVSAVLDEDEVERPHQVSCLYHSLRAAQEMAEVYRRAVKRPQFVNVSTRFGYDDAGRICGDAGRA